MADAAAQAWKPKTNPWLIAATVALAAFMEVLDTSIANVALPHIAGSLGASSDQSTWVLTSYLVANAIVLPMGAWAASVIGRKKFFMLCIVIFTVSSFSVWHCAEPGPSAAVSRVSGRRRRRTAAHGAGHYGRLLRAIEARTCLLALWIGRGAGAFDRAHPGRLDHRQLLLALDFYINIPVGMLALFLTNRLVEDPPYQKSDRKNLFRIDYIGVGLLVISMARCRSRSIRAKKRTGSGRTLSLGFALVFIASFISSHRVGVPGRKTVDGFASVQVQELRRLRLSDVADRRLLNATTVLQPQFLQQDLGYTATIAGLSLSGGGSGAADRHAHGRPGGQPLSRA